MMESRRKGASSMLLLFYHVDFAVERVAVIVVGFGDNAIEKQVAIFPKTPAGIGDAYAVLSSAFALFWSRVHCRDQFPSAGRRVNVALGLGVEPGVRAVAAVENVDLRAACVGMPGISVDLSDFCNAAEIHA